MITVSLLINVYIRRDLPNARLLPIIVLWGKVE